MSYSEVTTQFWGEKFAAGACTGVVTKTAIAPMERLKILFQVQGIALAQNQGQAGPKQANPYGRTIWEGVMQIHQRDGGIKGFWRGNFANCIRVIPVYSLKFGFNDIFKKLAQKRRFL